MEAVTQSQYKRSFLKFEAELITATVVMGHHARIWFGFCGWARILVVNLLHTYTHLHAQTVRPAGRVPGG